MAVSSAARHFCSAKILAGRAAMGDGALIAEGEAPAQRNFQRKFALRRVGSYKFVVPPTIEYSKVRSTLNWYNHPYRAARVPEGPRPSVSEGVQRKPFRRVSFGQFLRGGSTPRFFAQLRSVGSKRTSWQVSARTSPGPRVRQKSPSLSAGSKNKNPLPIRQEVKRQPRQARPNLNLSLKPSQDFYKLRCCPAAAANETRAGFDKPLHMLRKLA